MHFLDNSLHVQQSLSTTLESTSVFTVTTMSSEAESSVVSTGATTQRNTSSRTPGVAKTSATSNLKCFLLLRPDG